MGAGAAAGAASWRRAVRVLLRAVAHGAGRDGVVAPGTMADAAGRLGVRLVARGAVGVPARDEQALAGVDRVRIGDRAPVDMEDAPPGPFVAIVQPRDALQRVAWGDDVPAGTLHRPAGPPARVRPGLVPVSHPPPWAVVVFLDGVPPPVHPFGCRLDGPRPVPLVIVRCGRRPIPLPPIGTRGRQVRWDCRRDWRMQPGRSLGQQVHRLLEALPGVSEPPPGHLPGGRPAPALPAGAAGVAAVGLPGDRRGRHGQRPAGRQAGSGPRWLSPGRNGASSKEREPATRAPNSELCSPNERCR